MSIFCLCRDRDSNQVRPNLNSSLNDVGHCAQLVIGNYTASSVLLSICPATRYYEMGHFPAILRF